MAGRVSKPKEEVLAKLCEALRLGAPRRAACAHAGISEDTFRNRYKDTVDSSFSDAIKKAESDAEITALASIKKAASGYPVLRIVTKTVTTAVKDSKGVVVLGEDGKPMYYTDETKTVTESREFSWQAGAWLLERRKPEDYARFVLDLTKCTPEQISYIAGLSARSEPEGSTGSADPNDADKTDPAQ